MSTSLDQSWPAEGLERVETCPYCGSSERTLAYGDVQDWSFNCAPGKWDYWDCINCKSLYLDPRPTRSTIGSAYTKYYTHGSASPVSFLQATKTRLRNECLSQMLRATIEPRLNLPRVFSGVISLISQRIVVPFGWAQLAKQTKGRFMDVGCGAGLTVSLAQQLGWDAMGIEIDPAAVRTAQQTRLNIIEGTYEKLNQYEQQFDCIMCSHVLEHVHDPRDLLTMLKIAIKPGGMLLLTLPNSLSILRRHFGANWRGLEAPRHIAIPSESQLMQLLAESGFSIQSVADDQIETAPESFQIQRRGTVLNGQDIAMARQLQTQLHRSSMGNDFIKLVCEAPVGSNT